MSIVNGYVKDHMYTGDGTLLIQVRIPSIHGPMNLKEYKGQPVRNYTPDEKLPYYSAMLMPHLPTEGEVVAMLSSGTDFFVLGLTGGSYYREEQE